MIIASKSWCQVTYTHQSNFHTQTLWGGISASVSLCCVTNYLKTLWLNMIILFLLFYELVICSHGLTCNHSCSYSCRTAWLELEDLTHKAGSWCWLFAGRSPFTWLLILCRVTGLFCGMVVFMFLEYDSGIWDLKSSLQNVQNHFYDILLVKQEGGKINSISWFLDRKSNKTTLQRDTEKERCD